MSYSADVQYRSPQGVLVLFEDSGNVTATINRITIRALVPGNNYQFRVSAVTTSGRGAEISVTGQTQRSSGNKLGNELLHSIDKLIVLICRYVLFGILPNSNWTDSKLCRIYGSHDY